MYIPDLFGAYVKGRELAIAKNWDDLKNYESVENARNQNDLSAMDIWERRQQMPGKMNMFYNNTDISQMNTDVAREAHAGLMANARTGSLHAQDNHAIFLENRDYGRNVANRLYRANLGMLDAAGQNKQGQANFWLTNNRGYDAGGMTGQIAYDTLRGNSQEAANYPTVAQQRISEGNAAHAMNMSNYGYQTDYLDRRRKQLPNEMTLQDLHTQNGIHTAQGFIAKQEADQKTQKDNQLLSLFQEQSSLLDKLSTVTDPATRQALQSQIGYLQDYMQGMGYTPSTGQTQNSEPVTPKIPEWGIRSLLPPMFQTPNGGVAYNYPISPEYGSYSPTAPQTANVNGQTNSLMTPVQEPHRAGTASLVPPAYDPNLWSNYKK